MWLFLVSFLPRQLFGELFVLCAMLLQLWAQLESRLRQGAISIIDVLRCLVWLPLIPWRRREERLNEW